MIVVPAWVEVNIAPGPSWGPCASARPSRPGSALSQVEVAAITRIVRVPQKVEQARARGHQHAAGTADHQRQQVVGELPPGGGGTPRPAQPIDLELRAIEDAALSPEAGSEVRALLLTLANGHGAIARELAGAARHDVAATELVDQAHQALGVALALHLLGEDLSVGTPDLVRDALYFLGEVTCRTTAHDLTEAVAGLLRSDDDLVLRAAAWCFGALAKAGAAYPAGTRDLVDLALRHPLETVRFEAVTALAKAATARRASRDSGAGRRRRP